MNRVALLLSGGIDSTAIAYWQRPQYALTIDYGQASAQGEIRAAKQVSLELGIAHEIISVDCQKLGAGDLAGKPSAPNAPASEWWPYRNQLLVTLAAMRGYVLGVNTLMVGSVKSDSFHVDGTADFYSIMDSLLVLQEGSLRVEAPGLEYTATDLVKMAGVPRSLMGWTHSCHRASFACGSCRGCAKHRSVFRELGYVA